MSAVEAAPPPPRPPRPSGPAIALGKDKKSKLRTKASGYSVDLESVDFGDEAGHESRRRSLTIGSRPSNSRRAVEKPQACVPHVIDSSGRSPKSQAKTEKSPSAGPVPKPGRPPPPRSVTQPLLDPAPSSSSSSSAQPPFGRSISHQQQKTQGEEPRYESVDPKARTRLQEQEPRYEGVMVLPGGIVVDSGTTPTPGPKKQQTEEPRYEGVPVLLKGTEEPSSPSSLYATPKKQAEPRYEGVPVLPKGESRSGSGGPENSPSTSPPKYAVPNKSRVEEPKYEGVAVLRRRLSSEGSIGSSSMGVATALGNARKRLSSPTGSREVSPMPQLPEGEVTGEATPSPPILLPSKATPPVRSTPSPVGGSRPPLAPKRQRSLSSPSRATPPPRTTPPPRATPPPPPQSVALSSPVTTPPPQKVPPLTTPPPRLVPSPPVQTAPLLVSTPKIKTQEPKASTSPTRKDASASPSYPKPTTPTTTPTSTGSAPALLKTSPRRSSEPNQFLFPPPPAPQEPSSSSTADAATEPSNDTPAVPPRPFMPPRPFPPGGSSRRVPKKPHHPGAPRPTSAPPKAAISVNSGANPPVPARPKTSPSRPTKRRSPRQAPKQGGGAAGPPPKQSPGSPAPGSTPGVNSTPELSSLNASPGQSPDHVTDSPMKADQLLSPSRSKGSSSAPQLSSTAADSTNVATPSPTGVKRVSFVLGPSPKEPEVADTAQSTPLSPTSTNSFSSDATEGEGEGHGGGGDGGVSVGGAQRPDDYSRQQSSEHEGEKEDLVSTLPSTGSPGGKGGKGRKIMASMKKSFRSLRQIGSTRKSPGTERKRHSEPDFYQSSNNKFYPDPLPQGIIHPLVVQCVAYLNRESVLEEEGLFRVPGDLAVIKRLREEFMQGYYVDLTEILDPHTVAGLLKLYFREQKASLIPRGQVCSQLIAHVKNQDVEAVKETFENVEMVNVATLSVVIEVLAKISSHSSKNFMSSGILATSCGPSLFPYLPPSNSNQLTKFLIDNFNTIFQSGPSPPPSASD